MGKKKVVVTPLIFQEVIDEIQNNPKWDKYEMQSTIDWLQNAIKLLNEGKQINLKNLLGCRKRILGDDTSYRLENAKERKANRANRLKALTKEKDRLFLLKINAETEEERKKYEELHELAMKAVQDFMRE